jgi:hypothetical protein
MKHGIPILKILYLIIIFSLSIFVTILKVFVWNIVKLFRLEFLVLFFCVIQFIVRLLNRTDKRGLVLLIRYVWIDPFFVHIFGWTILHIVILILTLWIINFRLLGFAISTSHRYCLLSDLDRKLIVTCFFKTIIKNKWNSKSKSNKSIRSTRWVWGSNLTSRMNLHVWLPLNLSISNSPDRNL